MGAEHQLIDGKDNSDPPYQGELRPSDRRTVGGVQLDRHDGAHRNDHDHDDHHYNDQCGRQCRWWLPRKAWFSGWCRTR